MKKKLISLVVACYNEEENIQPMYRRVKAVFARLPRYAFELIYVDNSSTDASEKVFARLAQKDKRIKIVFMSRNFGSPQPSYLAGFSYMRGVAAVILHGDIQDPPELIPSLIKKWEEGYEVVYGIRTLRRGYGLVWNLFYKGFYFLLNRLAYFQIPRDAGDFSLLDHRVVGELLAIEEYDYYLRCLRAFVGFRQIGVPYIRAARLHGPYESRLITNLYWAITMIVNFSFKPLEWIALLGFFVMAMTFLLVAVDIVGFIFFRNSPPGIPTIVILILFLGGVQLLSLSVMAEYLSRIFLEVKKRPRYIVRKTLNVTPTSPGST